MHDEYTGLTPWGVADFFEILLEICGAYKKINSLKKLWGPYKKVVISVPVASSLAFRCTTNLL